MEIEELKSLVQEEVDAHRRELIDLSLRIHGNPETAFVEFKACGWLVEFLEENGFQVEKGTAGLPTAFKAVYGQGTPVIAILAEYDALPGVGHACGHNIMGASAVGAGVAAKRAADALGGTIVVFGTPGEEGSGGKVVMVKEGAFAGVDAALIVHPGVRNITLSHSLACIGLKVEFFGRSSHAAARPEEGINALDALILSFNNINALRQHIRSTARIHGIITDGGAAPNVVPSHAAGSFIVRAADDAYLEELRERVLRCFEAGAAATGARLEYRWADETYAAMRTNRVLAGLFGANLRLLGREVQKPDPRRGFGSTDMGNVSAVVPSIHPSVAIAPVGTLSHSPDFAAAACSEAGHQGLLDAAKAMAMTAVDLLGDPALLSAVREEFDHARS